jgi:hypothetical protein
MTWPKRASSSASRTSALGSNRTSAFSRTLRDSLSTRPKWPSQLENVVRSPVAFRAPTSGRMRGSDRVGSPGRFSARGLVFHVASPPSVSIIVQGASGSGQSPQRHVPKCNAAFPDRQACDGAGWGQRNSALTFRSLPSYGRMSETTSLATSSTLMYETSIRRQP